MKLNHIFIREQEFYSIWPSGVAARQTARLHLLGREGRAWKCCREQREYFAFRSWMLKIFPQKSLLRVRDSKKRPKMRVLQPSYLCFYLNCFFRISLVLEASECLKSKFPILVRNQRENSPSGVCWNGVSRWQERYRRGMRSVSTVKTYQSSCLRGAGKKRGVKQRVPLYLPLITPTILHRGDTEFWKLQSLVCKLLKHFLSVFSPLCSLECYCHYYRKNSPDRAKVHTINGAFTPLA